MRDNVRTALDRFCDWRERAGSRITRVRVNVTEKYLRRPLGLKKRDPLAWRDVAVIARDTPLPIDSHDLNDSVEER